LERRLKYFGIYSIPDAKHEGVPVMTLRMLAMSGNSWRGSIGRHHSAEAVEDHDDKEEQLQFFMAA
jgi:hypothetical protein